MLKKDLFSWDEHESVHFYSDQKTGLEAIVALHTTFSGVSLGGCRIKNFSSRDEALKDVLRLSRHMTYKSLLFDLEIGGGKSVIIISEKNQKNPRLLKAFADSLNSLGGQYIVSVDVGSDIQDMESIRKFTQYVIGYNDEEGGAGDPGLYTSAGVFLSMQAALEEIYGNSSFEDKTVCVSGLGNVGWPLCRKLLEHKARLIVSDIDTQKVQEVKNLGNSIQVVEPHQAHQVECDIFSPCAFGGVINEQTCPEFRCQIVAGGANNQLSSLKSGKALYQRGILYLPDFVVNSGGLIGVVIRGLRKKSLDESYKKISEIASLSKHIIQESKNKSLSTSEVSLNIAHQRYKKIYSRTNIYHEEDLI